MEWYYYVALIAMALICYFVVVGVRSSKGIKAKEEAEEKARKAAKNAKNRQKKRNRR